VTDIAERGEDVRVQRSRTLIQQALFDLIVEKDYAAVTVRDIALRAKVNRSTFYRHYLDKADLLAHYLDQLQKDVAQAAEADRRPKAGARRPTSPGEPRARACGVLPGHAGRPRRPGLRRPLSPRVGTTLPLALRAGRHEGHTA
jgi:AcrR family transcriptional regulator